MLHRVFARFVPALAGLSLLALPALVRAQDAPAAPHTLYPLTVTDDTGTQVVFQAPPKRIVSLTPGDTEIVFALGAGDHLVGVDTYSLYPPAAKAIQPHLNTYPRPSLESIVALQPDLVLALVEGDDVVAQMRNSGIPVLKLFPRDFDATLREIGLIGQVLDTSSQAQTITDDMQARRDAVVRAVADAPRPRVFYEMDASDPTRPFTAGPNGFYGQLVDLAGGDNVFGDLPGDFAQVSSEAVVDRNPDLILLTDAYAPYNPQTPAMVAARPAWDQITAVQDGAIYGVQAELFSSPGPRLIDGLESLAYLLHPDRFASSGGPHLAPGETAAPFCSAGQTPAFTFGFGTLNDALGTTMGEPSECAHVDPTSRDTYQQTTKGLAIYRAATNLPLFTSGSDHWALVSSGLVAWSGDSLDPPADAS